MLFIYFFHFNSIINAFLVTLHQKISLKCCDFCFLKSLLYRGRVFFVNSVSFQKVFFSCFCKATIISSLNGELNASMYVYYI